MGLVAEPLTEARGLEHVGVVDCSRSIFWVLLVHVGLLVLCVVKVLEGEPLKELALPIYNNPLIKRSRGDAVLHTADNLEFVFIDLTDMGYCSCGEILVFSLVLLNEGCCHVAEAIVVVVEEVHLVFTLDSHYVEPHHRREGVPTGFGLTAKVH